MKVVLENPHDDRGILSDNREIRAWEKCDTSRAHSVPVAHVSDSISYKFELLFIPDKN